MGYRDIQAGDKIGVAVGARFVESKKGTMGMEVEFNFEEPSKGSMETLRWTGWLSENAIEKTMETLVDVLEFNGDDSVDENSVLKNPTALNYNKKVKLVVELEDYNGKSYPKIKWVNNVSGSSFVGVEPTIVKSKLDNLGFKAKFLAAKQKSGSVATPVSTEEIPF